MLACHAGGPGSIPGRCNTFFSTSFAPPVNNITFPLKSNEAAAAASWTSRNKNKTAPSFSGIIFIWWQVDVINPVITPVGSDVNAPTLEVAIYQCPSAYNCHSQAMFPGITKLYPLFRRVPRRALRSSAPSFICRLGGDSLKFEPESVAFADTGKSCI
jgi:hypothetical protein